MKTKKIVSLLALSLITLTGCGGGGRGRSSSHTHNYDTDNIQWEWTYVGERNYAATATFTCLTCDYSTSGHTVKVGATVNYEITREATCQTDGEITYTAVVSFQKGTYSNQKKEVLHDPDAHNYIENQSAEFLYKAATCTEDAMYYKSCIHCHKMSTETFTATGTKLGHHMNHHARSESTCHEHGNIEYYFCDRCMKYFTDEAGQHEITQEETVLPFAHNMTEHLGHEATCGVDGALTYYTCSYEPGVYYKDKEGTQTFASFDDIVIPMPASDHEFNEHLVCKHCGENFKDLHDLQDVEQKDLIFPTTISDYGIEPQYIPSWKDADPKNQHLFGNYDFDGNKGIDMWVKMNYVTSSSDNYWFIYLFNHRDEDGFVMRFQLNRVEDDGILPVYIYTNMEHREGSTVVTGPGNPGTFFYFPRISGTVSEVDNLVHITAYCIDETTNKYRCAVTVGQTEEEQYYPSLNPEDQTNTEKTFDIVLGENYFENNRHNTVRITCSLADACYIDNYVKETASEVIYKDAAGNALGSLAGDTAVLPALSYEGKKFLGWFNQNYSRVKDGSAINSKTIVTPLFIDATDNMFTLSNYGFNTKDGWLDIKSGIGEKVSTNGNTVNKGEAIDLYFIYEVTSCTEGDNYTNFVFPYDTIDGGSRIVVRFNEYVGHTGYEGYISGADLGSAGDEGTYFTSEANKVAMNRIQHTLVHITLSSNNKNGVYFTLELTNLVTGASFSTSREATFGPAYDVTSEYLNRNKIAFVNPVGNVTARVTDAF